jgi:hypothetical protein
MAGGRRSARGPAGYPIDCQAETRSAGGGRRDRVAGTDVRGVFGKVSSRGSRRPIYRTVGRFGGIVGSDARSADRACRPRSPASEPTTFALAGPARRHRPRSSPRVRPTPHCRRRNARSEALTRPPNFRTARFGPATCPRRTVTRSGGRATGSSDRPTTAPSAGHDRPAARHRVPDSRHHHPPPDTPDRHRDTILRQPDTVVRQPDTVVRQPGTVDRTGDIVCRRPDAVRRPRIMACRHRDTAGRRPNARSVSPTWTSGRAMWDAGRGISAPAA